MRWLCFALAVFAAPVSAQDFAEAPAGVLRWLDKLTGNTGDLELARGQSASNGRLTIQLDACRYPVDDPASEAQAHLTIVDATREGPVFTGWMLTTSPALSALDHPRYDVWVLRCVVPGYTPPEADPATTDEAEGE